MESLQALRDLKHQISVELMTRVHDTTNAKDKMYFLETLEAAQFVLNLSDLDVGRWINRYSTRIRDWRMGNGSPTRKEIFFILSTIANHLQTPLTANEMRWYVEPDVTFQAQIVPYPAVTRDNLSAELVTQIQQRLENPENFVKTRFFLDTLNFVCDALNLSAKEIGIVYNIRTHRVTELRKGAIPMGREDREYFIKIVNAILARGQDPESSVNSSESAARSSRD